MFSDHPPMSSLPIPVKLSDAIIDYALESSPTAHMDAKSLSLMHPQLWQHAQGSLVANVHISYHRQHRNPIRFFTHAPHLIPYVHIIHLSNDKAQWQDQFPAIITMLTTGEGNAKKIILKHITMQDLLEVGANWEPFLDATICDCLFTFTDCFQWIKELRNLKTLTFSCKHPSACIRDLAPIAVAPLLAINTLMCHPEASCINIVMDKDFGTV